VPVALGSPAQIRFFLYSLRNNGWKHGADYGVFAQSPGFLVKLGSCTEFAKNISIKKLNGFLMTEKPL
jgi:hypothetical protein